MTIVYSRQTLVNIWHALRKIVEAFIEDDALSRGAAIAFFATTALAPIMFIVVSIVGSLFGSEAARAAMTSHVEVLIGPQVATLLRSAIRNAAYSAQGILPNMLSIGFLIVVASGAFSEMRTALNIIFRVEPKPMTVWYIVRTRAESLGLVAALAFLMLTSMLVTALIAVAGHAISGYIPASPVVLQAANFLVSWVIVAILFAAIYRVLPDTALPWRSLAMGGAATALLFLLGQFAISVYLGSSRAVSIYGAAGSLMALLLWIYYSAEIFLFGAELTKLFTKYRDR